VSKVLSAFRTLTISKILIHSLSPV
jgi:hypothetical protein